MKEKMCLTIYNSRNYIYVLDPYGLNLLSKTDYKFVNVRFFMNF